MSSRRLLSPVLLLGMLVIACSADESASPEVASPATDTTSSPASSAPPASTADVPDGPRLEVLYDGPVEGSPRRQSGEEMGIPAGSMVFELQLRALDLSHIETVEEFQRALSILRSGEDGTAEASGIAWAGDSEAGWFVIGFTPGAPSGEYEVTVRGQDAAGAPAEASIRLSYTGGAGSSAGGLATPPPASFFTFDDSVPADEQDRIRGYLVASQGYYEGLVGEPITMELVYGPDVMGDGAVAVAFPSQIVIRSSSRFWRDAPESQLNIVAHEMFHVVQFRYGNPQDMPWWLVEGPAEWFGWRAFEELGGGTAFEVARERNREWASEIPIPLQEFDPRMEYQNPYSLAFIGVDYLMEGRQPNVLIDFLEAFSTMGWESAFEATFGLASEDFHREFEEYRANGFERTVGG